MSATGVKWLTLAFKLKAIDVDIEATEFSNGTVQQRVIDALRIVKPMSPTRR
jgi:hypothetical protein